MYKMFKIRWICNNFSLLAMLISIESTGTAPIPYLADSSGTSLKEPSLQVRFRLICSIVYNVSLLSIQGRRHEFERRGRGGGQCIGRWGSISVLGQITYIMIWNQNQIISKKWFEIKIKIIFWNHSQNDFKSNHDFKSFLKSFLKAFNFIPVHQIFEH